MKIAVKETVISKIDEVEINNSFGARRIGLIEYKPELAESLNEIVFEFDIAHEAAFVAYLEKYSVIGRIFK